ncbi:VPLPA-CTERM sorting domain-containing protein [Rhodovulum marinum]|uniref:VPLPA-CTERM sorting domain-containing protein n=1 Tax=Rhodovulum marinum TaxID=320662 RepID=UPI001404EF62|nr:VPLPA-CTERM sorting domain-containing protein [Rhodovulum marinum]
MKKLITMAVVSTALAGAAGAAGAATVGFDLTISGEANGPVFSLANTSSAATITGGRAVIGNTAYNFDCVSNPVAPAGGTLGFTTPEVGTCYPGGGMRPDEIVFQVTDFDPGETLSFGTDIDRDFSDTSVYDFNVLLNGGRFEVTFAVPDLNGPLVAQFQPGQKSYSVSVTTGATPSAVPLPAGGVLILTALGALGAAARRKTR